MQYIYVSHVGKNNLGLTFVFGCDYTEILLGRLRFSWSNSFPLPCFNSPPEVAVGLFRDLLRVMLHYSKAEFCLNTDWFVDLGCGIFHSNIIIKFVEGQEMSSSQDWHALGQRCCNLYAGPLQLSWLLLYTLLLCTNLPSLYQGPNYFQWLTACWQ